MIRYKIGTKIHYFYRGKISPRHRNMVITGYVDINDSRNPAYNVEHEFEESPGNWRATPGGLVYHDQIVLRQTLKEAFETMEL
jgi:hypothetical protein